MDHDEDDGKELVSPAQDAVATEEDLPVVARLVVELRSDGRRILARGAISNEPTGERAAVEAVADSPLALMRMLARQMAQLGISAISPRRSLPSAAQGPRRGVLSRLRALGGHRRGD